MTLSKPKPALPSRIACAAKYSACGIQNSAPVRSVSHDARPAWSGWWWVTMRRLTGRPAMRPAKMRSHSARVASSPMPQSMKVQASPSSSSQRLMWSSANGSGMRSQCTPGAICRVSPGAGGAACGYSRMNSGVTRFGWREEVGVESGASRGERCEFSQIMAPPATDRTKALRIPPMNEPAETYSIADLAREFDVTHRTIRFYEDEGLLSPARDGTRRVYSKREWVRLKLILRGKRLGFSLAEVHEMLELYDSAPDERPQLEKFVAALAARREQLEHQREEIEEALSEIRAFERQSRKILAGARGRRPSARVRQT